MQHSCLLSSYCRRYPSAAAAASRRTRALPPLPWSLLLHTVPAPLLPPSATLPSLLSVVCRYELPTQLAFEFVYWTGYQEHNGIYIAYLQVGGFWVVVGRWARERAGTPGAAGAAATYMKWLPPCPRPSAAVHGAVPDIGSADRGPLTSQPLLHSGLPVHAQRWALGGGAAGPRLAAAHSLLQVSRFAAWLSPALGGHSLRSNRLLRRAPYHAGAATPLRALPCLPSRCRQHRRLPQPHAPGGGLCENQLSVLEPHRRQGPLPGERPPPACLPRREGAPLANPPRRLQW